VTSENCAGFDLFPELIFWGGGGLKAWGEKNQKALYHQQGKEKLWHRSVCPLQWAISEVLQYFTETIIY